MILFTGKAKDMTRKEISLTWYFGRPLKVTEINKN